MCLIVIQREPQNIALHRLFERDLITCALQLLQGRIVRTYFHPWTRHSLLRDRASITPCLEITHSRIGIVRPRERRPLVDDKAREWDVKAISVGVPLAQDVPENIVKVSGVAFEVFHFWVSVRIVGSLWSIADGCIRIEPRSLVRPIEFVLRDRLEKVVFRARVGSGLVEAAELGVCSHTYSDVEDIESSVRAWRRGKVARCNNGACREEVGGESLSYVEGGGIADERSSIVAHSTHEKMDVCNVARTIQRNLIGRDISAIYNNIPSESLVPGH